MNKTLFAVFLCLAAGLSSVTAHHPALAAKNSDYHVDVPFLYEEPPPLVLIVMGRNHKLYFEAYNDASDINEDGWLDVGYKGEDEPFTDENSNSYYDTGDTFTDINGDGKWNSGFDYYGYFDSYKCYQYDKTDKRFEPTRETVDKKCADVETDAFENEWSGDFLNYLTTSRMDALRKVLYGGYRSTDTSSETVLERVFIPQDAHSWGKEYHSTAHDGYDISDYTYLDQPVDNTRRHLFASTTRTSASDPPLLMVLPDSTHRIWDWVAKGALVCDDSVEDDGDPLTGIYSGDIVPKESDTADTMSWDEIISTYATTEHLQTDNGCVNPDTVEKVVVTDPTANQNPCMTDPDDYYIAVFTATLEVSALPASDTNGLWWGIDNLFRFQLAADNNMELIIRPLDGQQIRIPDPSSYTESKTQPALDKFTIDVDEYITGVYSTGNDKSNYVQLPTGSYDIEVRYHEKEDDEQWKLIFDRFIYNSNESSDKYCWMTSKSNGDSYWLQVQYFDGSVLPWFHKGITLTNAQWERTFYDLGKAEPVVSEIEFFETRVQACVPGLLESNCKQYPIDANNSVYRPTGLLHKYGETNKMYFGLLTGSYNKSGDGGVLRKNISSFSNEINSDGTFIKPDGIVDTIDKFRIVDYSYDEVDQNNGGYELCQRWDNNPSNAGECPDWGNPVAEMMYEGLRYFAGKKTPTTNYEPTNYEPTLSLTAPSWLDPYLAAPGWIDPYDPDNGGFEDCSKPYMLVISDINPTWDSDKLPGSFFDQSSAFTATSDMPADLNVQTLSDTIMEEEPEFTGEIFVGQKSSAESDNACSAKTVTDLGEIRGICPEVPGQQGSYYSVAVAYYGLKEDISATADGNQNVTSMMVALAAPLPEIKATVNGNDITIIPFGKAVVEHRSNVGNMNSLFPGSPNCAIVDFFIETLTPTAGTFRVNFEGAEYGEDYDQDAIVLYEYEVDEDNNTLTLTVSLEDSNASNVLHLGYIISGTTNDGPYLEIMNPDGDEADQPHNLDTPYLSSCTEDMTTSCCTGPNDPVNCWDDNVDLPQTHTRTFTPSSTAAITLLENPLYYAAKWGGFNDTDTPTEDTNNNGELDDGEDTNTNNAIDYIEDTKKFTPNLQSEWDADYDGVPDNYFYVINPSKLEEQLDNAFSLIESNTTSGTATSVISNSSEGEGAAYQATFYPRYEDDNGDSIYWAGQLNAYFIDSHGNFREDTDGDKQLDIKAESDSNNNAILDTEEDLDGDGVLDDTRDLIIVYNSDGSISRYDDENENSEVDDGEQVDTVNSLQSINYLWSATDWLNDPALDATTQRAYTSTDKKRYILTFIDQDQDGIVDDAGEQIAFSSATDPTTITPTDSATLYPYLTLYPSFEDIEGWVNTIKTNGNKTTFMQQQAQRVINYIRGEEQGILTIGSDTVDAMRSRTYYDSKHSETRVWRLGDMVSSSPTLVGRPAEMYHLLYKDESYTDFYVRYSKRRSVIYMGGNDGMLHAFNAGFYDSDSKEFLESIDEPYYDENGNGVHDTGERLLDWDGNGQNKTTAYTLGQELWAYVPYNLLPHLYWLTESDYQHVSYVDLRPRVFDAKVFFTDSNETAWDDDHPNGWGTILVAGMKMGGGKIIADMDRDDTPDTVTGADRIMSSAYVIMDITNPEKAPEVLAEINVPNLGYTTCYPAVVPIKNETTDNVGNTILEPNDWYLVFGSGPADSSGEAATGAVLQEAISQQDAHIFILDLKELLLGNPDYITDKPSSDTNSYVSAPMVADFDLNDFNPDAIYFGTVSGSESSGWGGKLRRIVTLGETNIGSWLYDRPLIDLTSTQQPITVAPNAGMGGYIKQYDNLGEFTNYGFTATDDPTDDNDTDDPTVRNRWIFFGTGRYYTSDDANNTDQQSFYAIKETFDAHDWTWGTVTTADLIDTSDVAIYSDKSVEFPETSLLRSIVSTWDELITEIDKSKGWHIAFENIQEKNINDSLLFGDLIYFTNYEPSIAACSLEGTGWLYALYYKTGTAYYNYTLDSLWTDYDNDGVMDTSEVSGWTDYDDDGEIDPGELDSWTDYDADGRMDSCEVPGWSDDDHDMVIDAGELSTWTDDNNDGVMDVGEVPGWDDKNGDGVIDAGELSTWSDYDDDDRMDVDEIEGWTDSNHDNKIDAGELDGWNDADNDGKMDANEVENVGRMNIGDGVPSLPALVTNDTDETEVVIQLSDGSSINLETNNPGQTKTGKSSWLQRR